MIDFSMMITKEQQQAQAVSVKKGEISSRRYQSEIGGITVNGIRIDTGRDSQALITGAALSSLLDKSYICKWKTPDGFVEFNSSELISISKSVREHVQKCFDRESELIELVDDENFETILQEGWPSND